MTNSVLGREYMKDKLKFLPSEYWELSCLYLIFVKKYCKSSITRRTRLSAAFFNQTFKQVPSSNNSGLYLSQMRQLFEASGNKTINFYINICFTLKYRDTFPHCKQCCLVQSHCCTPSFS